MSKLKKGLLGGALLVGESLANKLIGLISTLVLARILVPEDFGLVAIAMIVLSFVQTLANTGSSQYLLQLNNLTKDIINTSWTLNLLIKSFLALVMFLATETLAELYGDKRLIPILYVLAVMVLLQTLRNPGLAFLRHKQNYKPIVKLNVVAKFFSVFVAITVAVIDKSHWALILGQFSNTLITVLGTYFIHTHRPKLTLLNVAPQFNFTKWLVPQAVLGYFRTQLDSILVSTMFTKDMLGSYNVLKYIAFIPTSHIIQPATEPLLRQLSSVKEKKDAFQIQYNASFIATFIVSLPIAILGILYDELIVRILLGDKWVEYAYLFALFAMLIPATTLLNHGRRCLIVFGNTKSILKYEIVSFVTIYTALISMGFEDVKQFTEVRIALEVFCSLVLFIFVTQKYTSKQNAIQLIVSALPVVFASVISAYAVSLIHINLDIAVLKLALITILFGGAYALLLMGYLSFTKSTEWVYLKEKYGSLLSKK